MKQTSEAEKLRASYLELCEELISRAQTMRNFAMKPGNAWLAKAELNQISSLASDIEQILDAIKLADES